MRSEIGHYVHVHDQYHSFEVEGIFVGESQISNLFGEIKILVTKIRKESNPGKILLHKINIFPTPRYVPIFMRELNSTEKVLYGR